MPLIILFGIAIIVTFIVTPFVAMAKAANAERRAEDLARRLDMLERLVRKLTSGADIKEPAPAAVSLPAEVPEEVPDEITEPLESPKAAPAPPPAPVIQAPAPATEPPREEPETAPAWASKEVDDSASDAFDEEVFYPKTTPPPLPPAPRPEPKPAPVPDAKPIDWERFMGAKMFAWVGGLALFLGVAFFVKYSFERDLIPPTMRVSIGFLTGVGLLVGGVIMKRKETAVTAQTLCSTGILVLYGVTFACNYIYHFAAFGTTPCFFLMSLITVVAFLLSVRMNAMVVAILGIAGGFLTPVLFHSKSDAPLALFGYIALLDIGLLTVALRQRWSMLPVLGAIGTVLTEVGWIAKFFIPEQYFAGHKALIAMAVLFGFQALFMVATGWANRREERGREFSVPALVLGFAALAASFFFLYFAPLGNQPVMLFGYLLLVDAGLILLVLMDERLAPVEAFAGLAAFGFLTVWTRMYLGPAHLYAALGAYLVFALLHLAAAAVVRRMLGAKVPWAFHALPVLAMPFYFLFFQTVAQHPVLFFGSVFVMSLALLAMVLLEKDFAPAEGIAGAAALLLLGIWAVNNLTAAYLHVLLGVFLAFALLNLATPVVVRRVRGTGAPWPLHVLPVLALPFYLLSFQAVAQHPVLFFGAVFLVSAALLAVGLMEKDFAPAEGIAGIATFLLLGIWTGGHLTSGHLYVALALYFVFALFHSAAPVVIHKLRGTVLPWWCNAFPALALILVMMPIFKLTELTILVWPLVLLIDLLAIILSVITAALLPILVVLVLTLVAVGAWIFQIPAELTGLPTSLFMLGGFAVFFIVAATFASRKLMKSLAAAGKLSGIPGSLFGDASSPENLAVQIPVMSAALPFLLLIMLTLRLPLANPSPVFGLALLLVALLLGMTKIMSIDALAAVGLASVVALEHAWHFHNLNAAHGALPFAWYMIFYAVFTVFPFLFHRQFARSAIPWATAALAGPLHFYLLKELIPAAWPGMAGKMGLLPAALSVPALLGVAALLKRTPADSPARNSQLAWFGGIALFFITLIFPIQFDRQWITLGWALEGAALCWLFRRVPHKGLPLAATGLLVTAFVRLALNPAVLEYHERTSTPIFNWYLYAYGVTAACLFAGAWLLAPSRHKVLGSDVPPVFQGLGTVLVFLLVNIEIADFFTVPGAKSLTFEFSGNFARDMSYSIAWALFALLMLVAGIGKRLAPVRYASIGLLAVTLLKLFLHDLSRLDQLYRIAAFIVVAVIAIFASFLYQRFLGSPEKDNETPPAP